MLYDINFLQSGMTFPPIGEIERLQKYKDNKLLFEGETYNVHKHLFKDAQARITRVLNDYSDMIAYPVDINYHKLTSVKTMDFVCGETPTITAGDDSDIESLIEQLQIYGKLSEWVIDISRYGDALARVYKNDKGKAQVAVIEPCTAFKIVSREDKNEQLEWALCTVEIIDEAKDKYALNCQIHYKGYYITKVFALEVMPAPERLKNNRIISNLKNFLIKKQIEDDIRVETGLSDFAIISLHQLMTSDSCWGHDDYASIDPILAEIWVRLGQISIILDKHSRPDMYGPISAFEQDNKSGAWKMKSGGGNTWILNSREDVPPGYVTWDGQLGAAFTEINMLFDQLYQVSEMGAVYKAASQGSNISFETMKATFMSVLAKAQRIAKDITAPIKKIIALASEYESITISEDDITVEWFDGLPNDERQEIEKATMKINAGLSYPKKENQDRFGYTDEVAEEIEEKVREHRQDSQASSFGGSTFDGGLNE